jgi:1-acyl-sn-glycerol-3-phosphate acyltransferase
MFLTIFSLSFVVVWCIPWMIFVSTMVFLFPRLRGGDFSCYWARTYWAPAMFWAGQQEFILEGAENCPRDQPCIYLCNHQGIGDVPMIYCLPVTLRFVAKTPIKYVPFLGWYMLADRHVFIDRFNRNDAIRSLQKASEQIRSGINVVMFPEGTRTRDGRVLPFKKGPFRLALEAQVPIVPMALEGSRNAWPKGKLWIQSSTLKLKVGKPIPTQGLSQKDRDELMAKVRRAIIELHTQIGGAGGDLDDNIAPEGQQGQHPRATESHSSSTPSSASASTSSSQNAEGRTA